MSRRPWTIRFPDHLPAVSALITAILVSAYLVAPVLAESVLGRPSSTAGLGLVFGPFFGLVFGGAAFAVASLLRVLARRVGIPSLVVPTWLLGSTLILTAAGVGLLAFNARAEVTAREFQRRPRVIIESPNMVKAVPIPDGPASGVEAPLLFSIYGDEVVPSLEWNGRSVTVTGENESVQVVDSAGRLLAATDLRAFDYIGRIRAIPFCGEERDARGLAVLVDLRATSQRSMLILYGPDGAAAYQEHLERGRAGSFGTSAMFVESREGGEVLRVEHGSVDAYECWGF